MIARSCAYLIGILLSICLAACASQAPAGNPRPAWIDNPGNGVSASAGMHVLGRAAQEELAIARARSEFAKRYGVAINADLTFSTSVRNGEAHTTSSNTSTEATRQSDIKTMVKAKWRDDDADVLWVWLVPAN